MTYLGLKGYLKREP